MTKTYKANTVFSCTLPSGRHVRFLPHSYGGSRLTTADASLQRELEASGMMGREYWLMETREAPQAPAAGERGLPESDPEDVRCLGPRGPSRPQAAHVLGQSRVLNPRSQLERQSRLVMLSAPKEHIDWENIAPTAQYTWDNDLGLLTVLLPRDMLMLSAAKMKCWRRPVLRVTDIDSAKYQSTMAEFDSLRPTPRRPLTALIQHPSGPLLEMWGCTSPEPDYILLRRAPHITPDADSTDKLSGTIDVPAILQAPYVYMTAALTAESLKDTQKAQTLISLAQGMLGVGIERRAIYQPRPTTAGAPETSTIPQPQQQ